MTIEIASLSDLDPDLVQQQLLQTVARLQEQNPTLDLKRGVFHDTLAYFHAVLAAAGLQSLQRYQSAQSLLAIEKDPSLADAGVVENVLSNWGVDRKLGTLAVGDVTIVLSRDTSVTLANGTTFQAGGLEYRTTSVYTAKTEAGLINNDSDRLLTQLQDGNWAFTITVQAVDVGEAYKLSKDTTIVPESLPSNFVIAYATEDFTSGTNTETNQDLLTRLQEGIAAKALSNRINMSAMLRQIEAFSRIVAMSIIGYGDAEQLRDQHSLFPISYGGRVDWYVRTQSRIYRQALSKVAVLVNKTNDNRGVWQFSVSKNDAPGFYEIRNIRFTGAIATVGGFTVVAEHRSLDLTDGGFLPDVINLMEGAYTSYQTAVIQFQDHLTDTTSLAAGARQTYEFEAVIVPQLADLQALISSRDVRSYGADVLMRAPIPCFVQISFTVHKRSDEPDPDVDGIKTAVMNVVNAVEFTGRLYASNIQDAVHTFLHNSSSVGAVDMFGRIRRPDGTNQYLRNTEVLRVTDDPANMVTSKTVQFFLEPEDISVTIATTIPLPV